MGKKHKLVLDLTDSKNIIPLESLQILLAGDANDKFKLISKKIGSTEVKLTLKHRKEEDIVKIKVPIEFLEFNRIPYKDPKAPTDKQIEGIILNKVRDWKLEYIVTDLSKGFDLVVVRDIASNQLVGCKVDKFYIQTLEGYAELCTSCKDFNFSISKIKLWRESSWRNEIQTKVGLLKLNPQIQPEKAFCQ